MTKKEVITIAIVFILAIGFGFGITAGLAYGICWMFGFKFTWKMVIGIYLVMVLSKIASHKKNDKNSKESL